MRRLALCLALLMPLACGNGAKSEEKSTDAHLAAADMAADVEQAPVPADPDCNPIVGSDCWSGWPSDFWTKADGKAKTGRRLDLPLGKMPKNADGKPVDPKEMNRRDGFSPASPIVVLLPRPLDPKQFVGEVQALERPALDQDWPSQPVCLLDDSGNKLPVLAELDLQAPDPQRQALIVRPLYVPQLHKRPARLTVVLTADLKAVDGKPFARTEAMQRLLDGKATGYPRIDQDLAAWQASAKLAQKCGGSGVLAAWPYTLASEEWVTGVASQAQQAIAAEANKGQLGYEIDQVELPAELTASLPGLSALGKKVKVAPLHQDLALRVRGRFQAPWVLTDDTQDGTLNWVDGGPQVALSGKVWRPFVILVPKQALDQPGSARMLLYGHGFLRGACVEGCVKPTDAEFLPRLTRVLGTVTVGTDWYGLSEKELGVALSVTQDFSNGAKLTDKLVQAVSQPIALTTVVAQKVLKDPALQVGGQALADTAKPWLYYGNSLGGILGTTATALDKTIQRAVMNVPGGVWSTMMNRSSNFKAFLDILSVSYPDPFTQQVLFAQMQSLWDLSDPVHFHAHRILASAQPGVQPPHTLWTVAMGDSQVPNFASALLSLAALSRPMPPAAQLWPSLQPAPAVDLPAGPNWFVQWDPRRGTHPPGNALPWPDNGAHLSTRWMPEFQQMIWRFLIGDGKVEPRYCLLSGRDKDGKLPCDLGQAIPANATELPPLPQIPPPPVP